MTLQEQDELYIWHPYTHQKNRVPPIPIVSGRGSLLTDENGKEYIDVISSWWVNIHGHGHPYIAEKIYAQAKTLEHVIFAGCTHEPAITLAGRLLSHLPGMSKIFYSDNGSTATEVAIKMALQYHSNRGTPKTKIVAFRDSYHGDTFGAMSISSRSLFTKAFDDKLFEVLFIDTPTDNNLSNTLKILEPLTDIACFIYEPILQGAGGMKMYDINSMNTLMQYFRDKKIFCIADEVLTGFYRTGTLFASDQLNIRPDIMCLSKGLTGGTMALGITACSQEIYEAFVSDDKMKTFYHGHSYTANPIACAAALASLDLTEEPECEQRVREICIQQQKFIATVIGTVRKKQIKNVRQCGTVIAFEILSDSGDGYLNNMNHLLTTHCLNHGVFLRPLGNTLYIMPPYCTTKEQLSTVYSVITDFLDN